MRAFSHILVPLDFSDANRKALAKAVQIADAVQGRITLLHVIEEVPFAENDKIEAFYDVLRQRAEQQMQQILTDDMPDRNVTTEIIVGRRGLEIVRFALEKEVDLVVMSSHRIDSDDLTRGWATLSYQVSILCPCSVLLVK